MRSRIALALVSCVVAVLAIEGLARVALRLTRGRSTIGLFERSRQLEYQPFTMFGPDWDAILGPYRRAGSASTRPLRVLLLGGSTAALFPPAALADAIREAHGAPAEVIVAAHGGYNARQELVLAALWASALAPDVVVTLDGANDLGHRIHGTPGQAFYLDDAYRVALKRPLAAPFAYLLRRSQAFHALRRLVERRRVRDADAYADALEPYLSAQRSLNVLARGLPARRVLVLQPFLAFKRPLSPDEARFDTYRYREAVLITLFDRLHERLRGLAAEDQVTYVDARWAFEGVPDTVFTDEVHLASDESYRRLARYIVKEAGPAIWAAGS
jgi:hypothetical protein